MHAKQRNHFDALYKANTDPWGYATLWREQRRHNLVMSILDRPYYERVFEPACSTGVLTAKLAERARVVIAWDGSKEAVLLADTALQSFEGVSIAHEHVPDHWPNGTFDLIVLSDFLYYLNPTDIARVAKRAQQSLAKGGFIITCHWVGVAHDFLTAGAGAVQDVLESQLGPVNGPAYLDNDQLIAGWTFDSKELSTVVDANSMPSGPAHADNAEQSHHGPR
jgi:SAM-dependent methyltransferase